MAMLGPAPNMIVYPMMYGGMKKSYQADLDRIKKDEITIEEWL